MEAEKYLVRTRALRSQRDVWKQAAMGVLALSIAGNIGLYAVGWAREARHQEEAKQLRAELRHVETVRDSALAELGRMANDYAREKLARQEQAEAYEAVGAWEYVGECTITAYYPCAECCGRWVDGVTASGLPATPGVVAVDPEGIPLGSTAVIDGQRYLAADTGSGVEGLHIDICMGSHEETVAHGVRTADVWVAKEAQP